MVAVGIAGAGKQPVVKAVLLAARTGDQARRFTSRSPVSKKSPSVKGVNRGAFGQTAKNLRGSDRGGNRPKKNSYLSYIAATTKCAGNDVNILPFVVIPFQEAKITSSARLVPGRTGYVMPGNRLIVEDRPALIERIE